MTRLPRLTVVGRNLAAPGAVVEIPSELVRGDNPGAAHYLREIGLLNDEIGQYSAALYALIEVGDARTAALIVQEIIKRTARLETFVNRLVDEIEPQGAIS